MPASVGCPANQVHQLDCGPEWAEVAPAELEDPGRAARTEILRRLRPGRCGGHLRAAGERKLSHMTAQPTEDPADPRVILRGLPERERGEFLRQYHQAVDAAHEPAGYQQLRRLLHVWSLAAIAAGQPGYYEELAAVRAGTASTVPVTDAIPDWTERVAAARDRR